MPIKEFKVTKSQYPEGDKKWLVVMQSKTEHGLNIQRVFKGTKQECEKKKEEMEKEYARSNR